MQLKTSPTAIAKIFFTIFFPAIPITVLIPSIASIKYSGGPNFNACCAKKGDKNNNTAALDNPPKVDEDIASPNASPLFPCCDIG